MATTPPAPVVHFFEEINPGKYLTVKHFELKKVSKSPALLSNQINISRNQDCAKSTPDFWLKEREGENWSKKTVTGLFKTKFRGVYKGDTRKKKDLLIFVFTHRASRLTIYYYQNYYTRDLQPVFSQLLPNPPETKKRSA